MARWRLLNPAWSHAICTTIAAILALYVAYFLQLESPYSAATTVLIVSNPVHGMVLAKSVHRFLGTVVGAAACVMLMACFAQAPELFLLGTAIWVGIFTALATLLRRFRAYGAVLAGYTVTLVAFGAIDSPLQIFDLAMSRIAVVSVGIASSALVTILLAANTASRDLPAKLETVLRGLAEFVSLALSTAADNQVAAERTEKARLIQALDTALYAAAAESADIGARSGYMRAGVAAAMGVLSSVTSLRESCEKMEQAEVRLLGQRAAGLFGHLAREGTSQALIVDIQELRQEGTFARAKLNAEQNLDLMIAFNRFDDLLDHLAALAENLRSFADKTMSRSDIRLPHHRDISAALTNGARAAFAVLVLSVFWIYSAWPNGAQVFSATIPLCALLGASDRQQSDSVDLFVGVLLAIVCGLVCDYVFLTKISGFPLLALAIVPFTMAAAYYSTKPRTAGMAVGFMAFFLTLAAPRNPMQFDLAAYLNLAFAYFLGAACLLPIFRLFFPQSHRRSTRELAGQLARSLRQFAARPRPGRLPSWEHRAHDRLVLIGNRLPVEDHERSQLLNGGFATLRIGRELVRIRSQLAGLSLDRGTQNIVALAFDACQQITIRPGQVAQRFLDAASRLDAAAADLPEQSKAGIKRSVAGLRECAVLFTRYSAFFTGKAPTASTKPIMQEVTPC